MKGIGKLSLLLKCWTLFLWNLECRLLSGFTHDESKLKVFLTRFSSQPDFKHWKSISLASCSREIVLEIPSRLLILTTFSLSFSFLILNRGARVIQSDSFFTEILLCAPFSSLKLNSMFPFASSSHLCSNPTSLRLQVFSFPLWKFPKSEESGIGIECLRLREAENSYISRNDIFKLRSNPPENLANWNAEDILFHTVYGMSACCHKRENRFEAGFGLWQNSLPSPPARKTKSKPRWSIGNQIRFPFTNDSRFKLERHTQLCGLCGWIASHQVWWMKPKAAFKASQSRIHYRNPLRLSYRWVIHFKWRRKSKAVCAYLIDFVREGKLDTRLFTENHFNVCV